MAKKSKEEWKTYQNVFDNFTYRTLHNLIAKNFIKGIEGPVSIGKESNVFKGYDKNDKHVIIKIYRLETCDFNRMYQYILYDPRFIGLKKQRRKVIFEWVKREYRNLIKTRALGIPVPKPITFLNNILLEEYIGDSDPAPKLKDKFPEDPKKFFDKIILYMKKLYQAEFVHGDLSHFNILNYNEKPILIDFSTMTPRGDSNFESYFERDMKNICNFSSKYGHVLNAKEEVEKIRKSAK